MNKTATREHPILFSAPMVNAILAGRKTMTRRVIKPQPCKCGQYRVESYSPVCIDRKGFEYDGEPIFGAYCECAEWGAKCPYGAPGDRLWVRETWQQSTPTGNGQWHTVDTICDLPHRKLLYAADTYRDEPPKWRPSIFMPRWASRITLEVTAVRVERLHEITEEDVKQEGFCPYQVPGTTTAEVFSLINVFRTLWHQINGEESWNANPWVWVIEFKRIDQ